MTDRERLASLVEAMTKTKASRHHLRRVLHECVDNMVEMVADHPGLAADMTRDQLVDLLVDHLGATDAIDLLN